MAGVRCFHSLNDSSGKSSGDYLERKRQTTIYKNLQQSVSANIKNPYNRVNIHDCGTLQSTYSYQSLLDLGKGKHYANPRLTGIGLSKQNDLFGQIMSVNYIGSQTVGTGSNMKYPIIGLKKTFLGTGTGTDIDSILQEDKIGTTISGGNNIQGLPATTTTGPTGPINQSWNIENYPGYVVDPSNEIVSTTSCVSANARMKQLSSISFTNQPAYWRIVNSQPLNGFGKTNWRGDISFKHDTCDQALTIDGPGMMPGTNYTSQKCINKTLANACNTSTVIGLWNISDTSVNRVPGYQPDCARNDACNNNKFN